MVCLVLISASTVVPTIALAQNGDELLIESNMSWEQDMSLSQNVRIINGGSLTISNSEITLAKGVDIFVEEGSALSIENSEMIAVEPPTGLKGFGPTYTEENNRSKIMISADGYPNGFNVILKSIDQYSLNGVTAYYNEQTENLSGSEYSLAFESGTGEKGNVRKGVRQIDEEWLILVAVDELDDFLRVAWGDHRLVDGGLDHPFVS